MRRFFVLSAWLAILGASDATAQTPSPAPLATAPVPGQALPMQPEALQAPTAVGSPNVSASPIAGGPSGLVPATPLAPSSTPPLADIPAGAVVPPMPGSLSPSLADANQFTVPQRFWFNAEYLLWFIRSSPMPPLVTSGSATDLHPAALGASGTQNVIDGPVNMGVRNGGRFTGGYWFTDTHLIGMDASFLFLAPERVSQGAASDGSPILGRPFFNALDNQQWASPVAFPGYQSGAVVADLNSQLYSADVNLRAAILYQPSYQLCMLGGFRYFNLSESLHTFEDDLYVPGLNISEMQVSDSIRTTNNFYGGQLGGDFSYVWRRWSFDVLGKVALGVMNESAHLKGSDTISYSDGSTMALGVGSIVQPSNSGSYGQSRFAVIPEGTATIGFAVTPHIRLTIGYTFLYVSDVFRPGPQIDQTVNPTQIPAMLAHQAPLGPDRPNFTFKSSDFWAQGINFGTMIRY